MGVGHVALWLTLFVDSSSSHIKKISFSLENKKKFAHGTTPKRNRRFSLLLFFALFPGGKNEWCLRRTTWLMHHYCREKSGLHLAMPCPSACAVGPIQNAIATWAPRGDPDEERPKLTTVDLAFTERREKSIRMEIWRR